MAAAPQWHKSTSKFGIVELSMPVLQTRLPLQEIDGIARARKSGSKYALRSGYKP